MTSETGNKHARRSAETRMRFIKAAQALFAERSIDSVSVNEITVAAGQKNRNALQYHFGNKNGLIQAIIDHHVARVNTLRGPILATLDPSASPAHNAAVALVRPVIEYVETEPTGVYYAKLISQVAAINLQETNPGVSSAFSFSFDERLRDTVVESIAHLSQEESQRRLFLVITLTFHGVADICRAHDPSAESEAGSYRKALMRELLHVVETILAAPASAD